MDSKDLLILTKIYNARKEYKPIPTIRELADYLNVSVGSMHKRVHDLDEGGFINKPPGKSRSIQITDEGLSVLRRSGIS